MPSAANLHCLVPDSIAIEGAAAGPLAGLTFVAKDLFAIEGRVASFGSARWRETHAPAAETADAVARLLGAGARLAGLAKMDQLAYSLVGNVGEGEAPINPAHPDRFAGGSSSGTASAVAGGLADFGIGTDTAGSIRVPAAACGIRSIRPTHGRVSARGVVPLAPSFDALGICGRSGGLLLDAFLAIGGAADAPEIAELLLAEDVLSDAEGGDEIALASRELARQRGLPVSVIAFSEFASEAAADLLTRLQGAEIWRAHGSWVDANREFLDEDVLARLERCRALAARPPAEEERDRRERARYAEAFARLVGATRAASARYAEAFARLVGATRAVVLPVLPCPTPLRTAGIAELRAFRARTLRLTAAASLAGAPEVVVPAAGAGLGILGPRGSDLPLLRLASTR